MQDKAMHQARACLIEAEAQSLNTDCDLDLYNTKLWTAHGHVAMKSMHKN